MITDDDLRHGENEGYNAGCREECCRRAHARYKNLRAMGRTRFYMDGLGSRRRIQALAAMGYAMTDLSTRLGLSRTYLSQILKGRLIRNDTAAVIARLYDELSMTPSEHPLATRARRHAQAAGWAPPLAWDDIDNDDAPAEAPVVAQTADEFVDENAVKRALDGDRSVRLTTAERRAVVARALLLQIPLQEVERRTGLKPDRYIERAKEAA